MRVGHSHRSGTTKAISEKNRSTNNKSNILHKATNKNRAGNIIKTYTSNIYRL